MIVTDCKQGSPEWHAARLGMPTASQFHRIITPKTMKVGAGAETYKRELLAEWLIGIPSGSDARGFMERGTNVEAIAVDWYEFQREVETQPVGVIAHDSGMAACSPDRLVGEDGGLEVKVPSAAVHVAHLLGGLDGEHRPQVQGALWITGRAWWDLLSYHPALPPAILRAERDEAYIEALSAAVLAFAADLFNARMDLLNMGCVPTPSLAREFAGTLEVAHAPAP